MTESREGGVVGRELTNLSEAKSRQGLGKTEVGKRSKVWDQKYGCSIRRRSNYSCPLS